LQHELVSNSTFHGTQNGIRIKTNRDSGGPINHIRYRDLLMDGVQHPIAFAAYCPTIPSVGDETQEAVSGTTLQISDVKVSHLEATDVRSAGWIIGLPEQPFERIRLSHVSISGEIGLQISQRFRIREVTMRKRYGFSASRSTGGNRPYVRPRLTRTTAGHHIGFPGTLGESTSRGGVLLNACPRRSPISIAHLDGGFCRPLNQLSKLVRVQRDAADVTGGRILDDRCARAAAHEALLGRIDHTVGARPRLRAWRAVPTQPTSPDTVGRRSQLRLGYPLYGTVRIRIRCLPSKSGRAS
jgi:hypothetical protein